MKSYGYMVSHRPGWSLDRRDPKFIEAFQPLWQWFYEHYFHVQTEGWEQVPDGQVMFVGSHNGGLAAPDMFMTFYDWFKRFGTERLVYGLMHPKVWIVSPFLASLAEQGGAIAAHPKMALAALDRNASILVYPGGAQDVFRPFHQRDQIQLANRKGFIKIALQRHVPIIPVVSWGAHDTLLVLGDIYPLIQHLHDRGMPWLFGVDPEVFPVYLGLPWGLALGPLPNVPLPRPIVTRVGAPIYFDRYGMDAARDRPYVDACYERVRHQMQQDLNSLIAKSSQMRR
ncbi:acyltransferase family protein [Oscillatoria sp. FACHB-1407]|uniref:lysophospholipid acyltransferase family protein n=1 Tax=Oscillatoria sp. FACHB-1407 TaxID=2692847 RepID=UPI001688A7B2|nr:lysophospholipid acyltransferase family protein [Oscillatoria sp. FACHB-1407]MBD2463721.1 acyltransferase family protein [Oscillatoria sp. FACHB-1407]